MVKNTSTRKRKLEDSEAVTHSKTSKRVNLKNDLVEDEPAEISKRKLQPVHLYEGTKLVDFNKNIHKFSNMRDFMDSLFETDTISADDITKSLILFLLETSGLQCDEKQTKKIVKKLFEDALKVKLDTLKFDMTKEQLSESNTLVLWNSYYSNGDYYINFKQIFSILSFICFESGLPEHEGIIDKIILALSKLSDSTYRRVRFPAMIAAGALFRS